MALTGLQWFSKGFTRHSFIVGTSFTWPRNQIEFLAMFMLALISSSNGHYSSMMEATKPVMTMIYHSHSTNLPASTQYHQWPKLHFNPTDYQKPMIPTSPSTPKQRPLESPLHQVAYRWLNFKCSLPPTVYSDNGVEKSFHTAPLDDLLWSKEPIPERYLWIHMAPDKPETSYPSQISMALQEPINEPVTWAELMDSMDSDIPNLIDVPEEVIFQDNILQPWMWTWLFDAS